MKKILLFFVVTLVMITIVYAQARIVLSINGSGKIVGLPLDKLMLVHIAKQPAFKKEFPQYFIVVRPIDTYNYKSFRIFTGSAENLSEVLQPTLFLDRNDDEILHIKTSAWEIIFKRHSTVVRLISLKGDTVIIDRVEL
jgi:hypothetical protein